MKLIIVGTIPLMGDFLEVITRFVVHPFHAFFPTAEALTTYLVLDKHLHSPLCCWIGSHVYVGMEVLKILFSPPYSGAYILLMSFSPRFSSYHYLYPWFVAHCCRCWLEQSRQRFDDGRPSPFFWKLEHISSGFIERYRRLDLLLFFLSGWHFLKYIFKTNGLRSVDMIWFPTALTGLTCTCSYSYSYVWKSPHW